MHWYARSKCDTQLAKMSFDETLHLTAVFFFLTITGDHSKIGPTVHTQNTTWYIFTYFYEQHLVQYTMDPRNNIFVISIHSIGYGGYPCLAYLYQPDREY